MLIAKEQSNFESMENGFFWIFTVVATAILLFVVTTRNHSARDRVDERKAATRISDKFNKSSSLPKGNLIDATADRNSSPLSDKTIQNQVVVTPVPKLEEKKTQWTYVEAFKALNTKNWLYRHHKPELVDEAERRSLEKHQKHFDDRLTPLFEIKKDYW